MLRLLDAGSRAIQNLIANGTEEADIPMFRIDLSRLIMDKIGG